MILAAVVLVLAVLAVPIAFAMGAASILQILALGNGLSLAWIPKRMIEGLASFPLLAVPFFVLAAEVMNAGGISDRIFRFATALTGHMRGGLGYVNIVASVIFSGMCGSAVAETAGLGKLSIKAMVDKGYGRPFAAVLTASSATIGPIIPPSIPMVIFGVVAEESVAKLLLGGAVPGILMALALALVVAWRARQRGYPAASRASVGTMAAAFREAFLSLMTPVILIGGILTGLFTPTEAAIVGAAYALFLALVVYRTLDLASAWDVFVRSGVDSAKVMVIVCLAYPVTFVLTAMEIPQAFLATFQGLSDRPWLFLLMVNGLLLVVGCLMEAVSAMIILVPLLAGTATALGIDPIHFGVIVVMNLMIGLVTPPFGLNMFITCQIAGVTQGQFVREAIPFYATLIAALMLVTFIPALSTAVPAYVFAR